MFWKTAKKARSPKPRDKSQQILNIIYFFDASRTKSFKITRKSFMMLLLLLSGALAWSIASVFVVYHGSSEIYRLRSEVSGTLETLFHYQSKYDQIFKIAYPTIIEKKAASDEEELQASTQSDNEAPIKEQKPIPPPAIIIEDPTIRWRDRDQQYDLSFAIRNARTPTRTSGRIWGIAKFSTQGNQEALYVASNPGLEIDKQGNAVSISGRTARYSIKHYTSRKFKFEVPAETELLGIKIFLTQEDDDETKAYVFSLGFLDNHKSGKPTPGYFMDTPVYQLAQIP